MRLVCKKYEQLPRLAWLMTVRRGEETAEIVHGPWIETRAGFICDGAWDGAFEEGRTDEACMAAGFGVRATNDRLVVSTPNHPYESVYTYRTDDRLLISPSLAFVLQTSGRRLSLQYIPYSALILESLSGLEHHEWSLPLENGEMLQAFRMRNLSVDSDLTLTTEHKMNPPAFPDYAAYRDFLVSGLQRLTANANDPQRDRRYPPLATISSGYDSCACAALSLELGCTEAITITSSRKMKSADTSDDLDDSGTPIANALGLNVREYERDAYKQAPGLPEAEFMALGSLGQDLVMRNLEEPVAQQMVLSGSHGDAVWTYHSRHPNVRDVVRRDPADSSLGEFRMRVGFVWVPVPVFGSVGFPDINRITRSEELNPWSVGGEYDRPIPRRLVEEHGVDRSLFGTKKRAITVLLDSPASISALLTPNSLKSFREFFALHRRTRKPGQQLLYSFMHRINRALALGINFANRVFRRLQLGIKIPNPMPLRFQHDPGESSFLVHWGLENVMPRYILEEDETAATADSR